MPGISDSMNPDDFRIHLEQVLRADARLSEPQPGESESDRLLRESVRLPRDLRVGLETVLNEVREATPGIDSATVDKVSTTLAGRSAREQGTKALARVDSHLRAVTGKPNPLIGRNYGVYGRNPESFAGVYRALLQSKAENDRIKALPESDPNAALRFTPVVEAAVTEAGAHLSALIGERVSSRAELIRKIAVKEETLDSSRIRLSSVREHLYANLPNGKKDPGLRDYGFRPPSTRGASREAEELVEAPATAE